MLTSEPKFRLQPHELHYNLGCILQQQAEPEQAIAHYRKAVWLSRRAGDLASCGDAHHNLGVVFAQQERWQLAIYHYRRSIALKQNPLAYSNLGTALLQQGETEAAIQVFQQAAKLPRPASAGVWASLHHNLAQALQQKPHEAIAAYRQSVAIDPSRAQVHYNLGRALLQQGDPAAAIGCFEQALRLDSSLSVVRGDFALAWLSLGQIDRAMQQFRAAIAPHHLFIAAYCDWVRSQPAEDEFARARLAVAEFLTTLQQNAADANWLVQALTHWGNVLTTYGGKSQVCYAERLYQQALQIQPQQIDLYQRLAHCLAQQQRFAAAIVICHLALAIDPRSAVIQAELGNLLQQRSQPPQHYQQAVEQKSSIESSACTLADPSAKSCEGLNCEFCLRQIRQWFEPVRLAEGIYQLSPRSPIPVADTSPDRAIVTIAEGSVWVAPQIDTWQACSAIVVFDAAGKPVLPLSRRYPAPLPNCLHSGSHSSSHSVPPPRVPDSLPPPLSVQGRVAVLSSLSGSVYFHWMIDLLPRLEILQRQIDLQQIDYFLVNSQQRSFQRETLQAFGIDADQIIESDRYPYVQAEQLIVPEFCGDLGWVQPWAIEFLRNKLLSQKHQNFLHNGDRKGYSNLEKELSGSLELDAISSSADLPFIYLSRADDRYRRLLNEDQVLDYLRPLGFVCLTLDSLSVTQQAALFFNAKIIVAPHGSSLTNLVFCQPQTQVVELVSPHYLRHYFWRISRALNLNHFVVWGEAISCQFLRQLMYPNPLLEDIWIDIDRLDQVMQKVLGEPYAPA